MPILKREPETFPVGIFDMSQPWWAAHVKSRQEKAFARYLSQWQIAYYLPQFEKRARRDGRGIASYLPLFPGYAFFRGFEADTARAIRSHLVVNLLAPFDQATFGAELRQLYDLQLSTGRLAPWPNVAPGDAVLITEGVFAGYRGVVVRERSVERLVVSVSFLRQCVAVEVGRENVRAEASRSAACGGNN
jgi:transcription antitermination factor NusG